MNKYILLLLFIPLMFLLGCHKSELQKMHESGKYNVAALEFSKSHKKDAYLTPSLLNPPFSSWHTNFQDESIYYIVEDGDSILFNGIAYWGAILNGEFCEYDIGKFVNGKKMEKIILQKHYLR